MLIGIRSKKVNLRTTYQALRYNVGIEGPIALILSPAFPSQLLTR